MNETAYAKINLALHVRRRREDGYHELETLFAFVDAGDQLSVTLSAQDELRPVGEVGEKLNAEQRAAAAEADRQAKLAAEAEVMAMLNRGENG